MPDDRSCSTPGRAGKEETAEARKPSSTSLSGRGEIGSTDGVGLGLCQKDEDHFAYRVGYIWYTFYKFVTHRTSAWSETSVRSQEYDGRFKRGQR